MNDRARGLGIVRAVAAAIVAVGLIGGVAACGGDDGGGEGTSDVSASDVENANGSIDVAGWQFYEIEKTQDAAVESEWSYISTDTDILTKGRSGNFDVITSAGPQMSALEALDVLQSIDTELLANYDAIESGLRDDEVWRNSDDQVVGVPFVVSPSVTAYNTDEVPEPRSLEDLLDPEYERGIGLFDFPEMIAQIATAQGVEDTTQMTQAELDEAMSFLEELRPNVKTFFQFGEDVQLFNRGDIVLSISSFGSLLSKAVENNPAIEWNFLAETTFIDSWSIVRDGNEADALKWIDDTLSKQGQEAIVDASGGYPVNPAAIDALKGLGDPVSEELGGMSLEEILEQAPISQGFATEGEGDIVTLDEATRAWNDYKASF